MPNQPLEPIGGKGRPPLAHLFIAPSSDKRALWEKSIRDTEANGIYEYERDGCPL